MTNEEFLLQNPHSTDGVNNVEYYAYAYAKGAVLSLIKELYDTPSKIIRNPDDKAHAIGLR